MGIYRNTDDVIRRLVELKREFEEIKTRQFIGSNQIVMYPYETSSTWDITLTANRAGQSIGSGWNVALITATAIDSSNLVADLVAQFSIAMPTGGDWVNVPQPANVSNRMQWYVPVFGTLGQSISVKARVIANTPVTITAKIGRASCRERVSSPV